MRAEKGKSHVGQWHILKRNLWYFSQATKAWIFPIIHSRTQFNYFGEIFLAGDWILSALQNWWQAPLSATGFVPVKIFMYVFLLPICINSINSFLLISCTWSLVCSFYRESLLLCLYCVIKQHPVRLCTSRCLTKWWKEWWDWGLLPDLLLLILIIISPLYSRTSASTLPNQYVKPMDRKNIHKVEVLLLQN